MWFWTILIRGLLTYLVLRLVHAVLGLGRLREAGALEFALFLVMAFFTGLTVTGDIANPLATAVVGLVWIGIFLVERYIFVRNRAFRKGTRQEPVVMVYRGRLLEHNLHRKRLTVEQLLSKLRARNVFHLMDVELAILEPDGELSVLRNPQAEPLTRQDMLVAGKDRGLEVEVICDGEIIHENLRRKNLSEKWLRDHLRAFNVEFVSEVALATVDNNNELYVDKYDDRISQNAELHPYQGKAEHGSCDSPRAQVLREKQLSRAEQVYAEQQMQRTIREGRPHVPKKK